MADQMVFKRKLDTVGAQKLLSATQPLRDADWLQQSMGERLQQAVALLDYKNGKPRQRAQCMREVANVLREVIADGDSIRAFLGTLGTHVLPEGARALGGVQQARVQMRVAPPAEPPRDPAGARSRIAQAIHVAIVASARKKKVKKEKKNNKKKTKIKAEASNETVTTGLPAKRMRSTRNSRGATSGTATPPPVADASSAPTISPAMRQRVLALLPTPRDRAAGVYAPLELTTILLANFPDGNFAQRPSDDPTGVRRAVTHILLEQRRVPIKSDRGLRKFLQKHVWGAEFSSPPEHWAQRGRQPLVTKGSMEALADEWFNDPSKGGVIEEPDLVAHLKELQQKRQAARHGGNGVVDTSTYV